MALLCFNFLLFLSMLGRLRGRTMIYDQRDHVFYPEDGTKPLETVTSGSNMTQGDTIWSPNAQVRLTMQPDGNLVVYRACDHHPIWATMTNRQRMQERPDAVQLQTDGNLVIYAPANSSQRVMWASGSNSAATAGASLRLENTGALCLFKTADVCLWHSDPNATVASHSACPEYIHSGANMTEDQSIWSPNRQARLTLETTGKAVIYRTCDGAPVWSSNMRKRHYGKNFLTMQPDGNAVIYEPNNIVIYEPNIKSSISRSRQQRPDRNLVVWSTDTHATFNAGASLRLDDTGSICLTKDNACLWRSGGATMATRTLYPEFANAEVIMKSGDNLTVGQTLWSINKTCSLSFRTNNQIVLRRRCDNAEMWSLDKRASINRGSEDATQLVMQRNGQLILYGVDNETIWNVTYAPRCSSFPTFKTKGAELRMAEDCRLCVFKDGFCHWTSSVRKSHCPSPFAVHEDDYDSESDQVVQLVSDSTSSTLISDCGNYSGSSLALSVFLTFLFIGVLLAAVILFARWRTGKATSDLWYSSLKKSSF
ncbi:hypothetical protein BV898_04195 [Hypsibius exemplaris]|uniref:Bulb-type lectin domain-containing protein n=1 Tax=Hypsibius exemplaris TaxID=2072580 RepID=A0A1W0X3U6_HYPEX|nr:hypothetical protein BV898_04195 [Hypsibius exemplaris]